MTVDRTCSVAIFAAFLLGTPALADLAPVPSVLQTTCIACHGANHQAEGSFDLNDPVATLIQKGMVVPGAPASSPIYQKIVGGLMPPNQTNAVSAADITVISDWIKSLQPSAPAAPSYALLTNAQALAKVEADRAALTDFDRGYMRYFSLVELKRLGRTDDEMQIYAQALTRTLNSVVWRNALVTPQPVGGSGLILSVNIKDLGWSPDFWQQQVQGLCPAENADSGTRDWSAYGQVQSDSTAAQSPLRFGPHDGSVRFQLSDSDLTDRELFLDLGSAQEQTDCITVPLDYFVGLFSNADVYRRILLTNPDTQITTMDQFAAEFLSAQFSFMPISTDPVMRLEESGVSLNNREIWRDTASTGSYFWHSGDFKSEIGPRNLTQNPGATPDAGEFILSLPNGYQAYFVATNDNTMITQADTSIVVDSTRVDNRVTAPSSCFTCHANLGLNPRAAGEAINATDPALASLVPWFAKDQDVYRNALIKTGAYRNDSIEPVTYVRKQLMVGVYR